GDTTSLLRQSSRRVLLRWLLPSVLLQCSRCAGNGRTRKGWIPTWWKSSIVTWSNILSPRKWFTGRGLRRLADTRHTNHYENGTVMLSIQITKRTDGSGVLRCVRADGSMTWQKQKSRHAAFFALHDLTHFAVESALEFRRGFYGLIADGWEIDDTTGKGTRGPLPDEAVEVEHLVGSFDSERSGGTLWIADEFNHY